MKLGSWPWYSATWHVTCHEVMIAMTHDIGAEIKSGIWMAAGGGGAGLLGVIYTLFASNLSFCSRLTKQIKVFPRVPTGGLGPGGWMGYILCRGSNFVFPLVITYSSAATAARTQLQHLLHPDPDILLSSSLCKQTFLLPAIYHLSI